ncbi:MAG TPA: ATP-binding cassette domain-containing protein, partial [Xanthobacteraceae bacterium]
MSTVLETVGLLKRFGGITATDNVTLKVEEGERLALIGPNGAGKTTLVNLLTGILRPSDGRILLEGKDITSRDPNERVHLG